MKIDTITNRLAADARRRHVEGSREVTKWIRIPLVILCLILGTAMIAYMTMPRQELKAAQQLLVGFIGDKAVEIRQNPLVWLTILGAITFMVLVLLLWEPFRRAWDRWMKG